MRSKKPSAAETAKAAVLPPSTILVAPRAAFTVKQFCADHDISRTRYYLLKREGRGPRTYRVGMREYVSAEAAAEWRKRMEQASIDSASGK